MQMTSSGWLDKLINNYNGDGVSVTTHKRTKTCTRDFIHAWISRALGYESEPLMVTFSKGETTEASYKYFHLIIDRDPSCERNKRLKIDSANSVTGPAINSNRFCLPTSVEELTEIIDWIYSEVHKEEKDMKEASVKENVNGVQELISSMNEINSASSRLVELNKAVAIKAMSTIVDTISYLMSPEIKTLTIAEIDSLGSVFNISQKLQSDSTQLPESYLRDLVNGKNATIAIRDTSVPGQTYRNSLVMTGNFGYNTDTFYFQLSKKSAVIWDILSVIKGSKHHSI